MLDEAPFLYLPIEKRLVRVMIRLENVNKYFGDLHVLKDVNLEVK